jgi:hypothetical protein
LGLAQQNIIEDEPFPLHCRETKKIFHVSFLDFQACNYTLAPASQCKVQTIIHFGFNFRVWLCFADQFTEVVSVGAKWSIPKKMESQKFNDVVYALFLSESVPVPARIFTRSFIKVSITKVAPDCIDIQVCQWLSTTD